jgi:hypothetical protein
MPTIPTIPSFAAYVHALIAECMSAIAEKTIPELPVLWGRVSGVESTPDATAWLQMSIEAFVAYLANTDNDAYSPSETQVLTVLGLAARCLWPCGIVKRSAVGPPVLMRFDTEAGSLPLMPPRKMKRLLFGELCTLVQALHAAAELLSTNSDSDSDNDDAELEAWRAERRRAIPIENAVRVLLLRERHAALRARGVPNPRACVNSSREGRLWKVTW